MDSTPSSRTQYVLITAFYFVAWFALRIPAIANNTIINDDWVLIVQDQYQILKGHEFMFLRSYRPLIYFEYVVLDSIFPGHFSTILPKIAGGIYISLSAILTTILLKRWGVPNIVSIAVPLLFVSHPAINEITIWNVTHSNSLAALCIIGGVLVWEKYDSLQRKLCGWLLILTGMLGYPIYVMIAVILLIAEWPIKRMIGTPYSFANLTGKFAFLFLAAIFCVGYLFVSREIIRYYSLKYDTRGFIIPSFNSVTLFSFIRNKIHKMLELMANAYMPIISFYAGIRNAKRIWRLIPVSLCILTFLMACLQKRGYLSSVLSVALPLIATIPLIGMTRDPVAWRVAVPVVYGAFLSLIPLLIFMLSGNSFVAKVPVQARTGFVVLLVVALFAVMAPVSWSEAQLRVSSNRKDAEVLNIIDRFWMSKGLNKQQYKILVDTGMAVQDKQNAPQNRVLTRGYEELTGFSQYGHPWAYGPFIAFHGFRPSLGKLSPSLYQEMVLQCRSQGNRVQGVTRLRILNSVEKRLSVICRDSTK